LHTIEDDWGKKERNDSMLRAAVGYFSMALKLRPDYSEADRAIQQLKFDIKAGMNARMQTTVDNI